MSTKSSSGITQNNNSFTSVNQSCDEEMSNQCAEKVISTLNCRYEIQQVLGEGADAVVYLARDITSS